jgi:FMN-dependent NADH-azoreductase
MKRLLHIIASPREDESRTLQIAGSFLDAFVEKHPEWVIDELDLGKEDLPSITAKQVGGKYVLLSGKDLYGRLKENWVEILQHIERFKMADFYLVSTPMWNFSIPYMLKHYIDIIVQPRYLFKFGENGQAIGLLNDKKMVVASSRGGQYTGDTKSLDFQEPYLRVIFGFVGITDIEFVKAEPMDMGAELQKEKLEEAKMAARELARRLDV